MRRRAVTDLESLVSLGPGCKESPWGGDRLLHMQGQQSQCVCSQRLRGQGRRALAMTSLLPLLAQLWRDSGEGH